MSSESIVLFITVFVISYIWHAMGITIGYHRLLTHRSFTCSKAVEYFWVIPAYLAFEGSPIWWVTVHRAHHRYEETALDPHSPGRGIAHAYFGWMFAKTYYAPMDPAIQAKDLLNDPLYKFLEQNGDWHKAHLLTFVIGFAFRILILICFGWVPALASLLAGSAALQIPLILNVICHIPKSGYKNYFTHDDSVNVWWIGLLAFGEGWHNNHHASPGSARTGMKSHEFDLSWLTIKLMKKLGLVSRVNEITEIQHRRLEASRKTDRAMYL